jgi:tetratricopeptide (TPR) repeat protein
VGHPSGGVIEVQVRNPNGTPGPRDIHIRLESAEGGAAADAETIDGGKCQFKLPTGGVYLVRLVEPQYKEVTERVELIGNSRGYVTIQLTPADSATTSATATLPGSVSVENLSVPENARKEYEKGDSALDAKDLSAAAKHFEKASKLFGDFPQTYWKLGEAYLEMKEWKKAETALKRSIELEPKLAAAYVDLGAVYNQTQDYPAAEQALKKGLELGPDAPAAEYELAKTYWAMGRWTEAEPLAQKASTSMPSLASVHVLLGNICLKKRDASGALREYEEYLKLDPQGAMAPQVKELIQKLQKSTH